MPPSQPSTAKRPARRRLVDYTPTYWQSASSASAASISVDDLPTPTLPSVEEATVSESLTCHSCDQVFATVDTFRHHFRSDWHRYNIKRRLRGHQGVTEAQFEDLSDLGSVESLSGSEPEHSADESNPEAAPTVRLAEKIEFRDPKVDNSFLVLYRAALPDQETIASLATRGSWAVIMAGGGHFCAGLWDVNGVLVKHKTFHRYTSRRKQGGSQAAADQARGAGNRIKSAGATLRRYGEQALQNEVHALLREWSEDLLAAQCIYVRASKREKRDLLFGWNGSPLETAEARNALRNIPLPTRRATLKEAKRVYEELSSVRISSTSLAATVEAKKLLEKAKPGPMPKAPKQVSTPVDKGPKEKGTDHLKKREESEKKVAKISEETEKREDLPVIDPETARLFSLCCEGARQELVDALSSDDAIKSIVFECHYFPSDARFEKVEGALGLIGVCAVCGHADVVEALLDHGVSPAIGASPYVSAKPKAVRLALRTYWGRHPSKYDYATAGIPGPLTEAEVEEMAERERAKRRKEREKKKDKAREKAKTPEQRARELRAAAAEARFLGNKCASCKKSLQGLTPFSRLAYKYCSTDCVNKHKQVLNSMK